MAADPRARLVEEFTADLARAVNEQAVRDLLGEPARRTALAIDRLVRMHLPGTVARCPDCRLAPDGRPCATWAVLAEALVGWESTLVDKEYARLSMRYPAVVPPTGVDICDRLHVVVFLGDEETALRLPREQVVNAASPGELGRPLVLILPDTVSSIGIGGRRYGVRQPARRVLSGPAESRPVVLAPDRVIQVTDGTDGWPLLVRLPRDVTEVRVYDGDQERSFPVHGKGLPVD